MTLLLLKKYKYIGQHPTKVSAVPYAPAVELDPGDELVSQIRLPSHLFKEVELSAEEALVHLGAASGNKKSEAEAKSEGDDLSSQSPQSWEELTIPQLVKILKANSIEIPKGTSKKAEFIALLDENKIELPKENSESEA